jgi:CspA family cold shock protein
MLKTITKFVVERRRLVRQRRQQVIEEGDNGDPSRHSEVQQREGDNGDPSRHSEVQQREGDNSDSSRHSKVPPQLAEPQLGEPPAPTVWGKVKWYNALKRYGFVELSDGSGDAFLHASALAGISVDALQPGVTIEFRTAPAQRGVQVTEVISVDSSTAAPPRPPRKSSRSPLDRQPLEASVQEMGTVKWYNVVKGFGFIAMDSGGRDVFVHASALDRAGITGLNEGQRVFVGVAEGQKGPEAASIRVAY